MTEEKEKLIRKCVHLTNEMIDGAWKGRINEDDVESLVAVIAGRGKESDYEHLASFGINRAVIDCG